MTDFTVDNRREKALEEAYREVEAIRRRAMKVGRILRENDFPNTQWQTNLLVDQVEVLRDRIGTLQDGERMKQEAAEPTTPSGRLYAVPTPWKETHR